MRFAIPISLVAAGLVAGSGALTASAADTPYSENTCFRVSQMTNWRPLDGNTGVAIKTSRRDVYTANFNSTCPDLQWKVSIGLKSRGNSRAYLCEGDDAIVYTTVNGLPLQCDVHNVHKLSSSELAGLSKAETP